MKTGRTGRRGRSIGWVTGMSECALSETAIRGTGETFSRLGGTVSRRLQELARANVLLLSTWTGDAATAYAQFFDRWLESADGLAESLQTIGDALTIMADNLRRTEDRAAEAWTA
jgi:WXG100 family type VII secretion target